MSMVSASSPLTVSTVTAPVSLSQNPMVALAQADIRVQNAANNVIQANARYQNEIDEIMKKKAEEIRKLEQSIAVLQKEIDAKNASYEVVVQSQNGQISHNTAVIAAWQTQNNDVENTINSHNSAHATLISHNQALSAKVSEVSIFFHQKFMRLMKFGVI